MGIASIWHGDLTVGVDGADTTVTCCTFLIIPFFKYTFAFISPKTQIDIMVSTARPDTHTYIYIGLQKAIHPY